MSARRLSRKTYDVTKERLPLKDMVTFSLGTFGKDAGNSLIMLYYMFFLTQVMGLNAAIVGGVFSFSRLLSAFSAPLIGTLIDNTRTRIGKYRPWILIGGIFAAVTVLVMFTNISVSDAAKYLFYLSFYFIYEFAALSIDIAIWAFLPTITHNVGDRHKVTSLSKMSSGIGNLTIAAGAPFFLSFFFGSEFEPRGYLILAMIVSIIMFTGAFLTYQLNKERVRIESNMIKIKDLIRALLHNDQLIAYFFSFLLINMAGFITGNFAIYFFAYDIGNMKFFGLFAVLTGLGQGIGLLTYPLMASRMPIRTILIIATVSSIIGYMLMLSIIIIFGSSNIILLCSAAVLMLFSGGWIATASQSMLLDITDYGEYKLGNRTASVVFSANSMMWRIISSFVIFALGLSLSFAGISGLDADSGEVAVISMQGIWLIRIMMTGVPIILISIGLIIFLTKYTLNVKEMTAIQTALKIRHDKQEEKRLRKQEYKELSQKLRDAKKAYRRDYWSKKLSWNESFVRTKKLSIKHTEKRMSLRDKEDEEDKNID